jgi:predicted AlkP superfamily pyrophosphatase or phosphodiesterase
MQTAERVVLIVVDGMRPEGMLQAGTTGMRRLGKMGASSLSAQTIMPSVTLPTHMSMFHGVLPEVHGVTSNEWKPMPDGAVPGIIDLVRREKRKAAAFYTWEQLRDLSRPGSLVYSSFVNIYGPDGADSDRAISRLAADYLVREQPDFTFIYLGLTDEVGHRYGWLSKEYLQAIAGADEATAHVLRTLESAGLLASTAVLLTADHGGHERAHGTEMPEDMTLPWVLAGTGVKQGYSITTPVRIYDTAPTIAYLLGLPIPSTWQGQPILDALDPQA